jgi:hypothetical protein
LSALLLFHSIRARREKNHPETEVTEPLMTRAEYGAMKLAEMAEAETAFEAQSEKAMEIQAETAPETPNEVTSEALPDEAVPQPETEVSHHE